MSDTGRRREIEQEIEQLREMLFELEAQADRLRAPTDDPVARARALEIVRRVLGQRWVSRLSRTGRQAIERPDRRDSVLAGIDEITRRIRAIDDRLVLELHRLERPRKASRRSS